jgi:hypothetical protein
LNIFDFTHLYRDKVHGVGLTGATVKLWLPIVKPGIIRRLTHVTVENETSDYTKVRLGIRNTGVFYFLDELQTISADELATAPSDFLLGEGDHFFSELIGTITSDSLILNAWGWENKR